MDEGMRRPFKDTALGVGHALSLLHWRGITWLALLTSEEQVVEFPCGPKLDYPLPDRNRRPHDWGGE